MSIAIIVAIVGVVSTMLGATIGAATSYVIARRTEIANEKRDRLNHAIKVMTAARLIQAELLRACAAASICVEKRQWWSGDLPELSTVAWERNSADIASDLSFEEWGAVVIGIEAVDGLRSGRRLFVDAGLADRGISDTTSEKIAPMRRDIKLAANALNPYVSGERR